MNISNFKKPLKRSITIGCILFVVCLSSFICIFGYLGDRKSLFEAYESRMTDILNYVYYHIDQDDLAQCVETGVPSDKYWELQDFMDEIMERMQLHYLYIIVPLDTYEPGNVINVLSADTAYGRMFEPDGYYLDYLIDDEYTREEALKYYNAMQKDDISFFEIVSGWGDDYSGIMPLKDSDGETYAILCVDFEISEIHNTILIYTISNVVMILLVSLVFSLIALSWINKNVTVPVVSLEKSVNDFAALSHIQRDPGLLRYDAPNITTQNEVESLANSINQMTQDIKTYAANILEAEVQVQDMKSQVTRMDMLAYQDALTHVKNKTWYDTIEERVNEDIALGIAEFAIIMVDLNDLKKINDTYGHDHGNEYIVGATKLICDICPFSAVFRVGGDEFVILLENKAYEEKDDLYNKLIQTFMNTSKDETQEPWKRYSAAFGLGVYNPYDTCMEDVFKRADKVMYENKQRMKKAEL